MDFLNYNSVETLPGYEARAAFTANSASVFKEDVDIVPTIVDDTLALIYSVGRRQSDAVRLVRARRERRNFGNLPMFQDRGMLWFGTAILHRRNNCKGQE